jgi:hypothetical protein
MTAVIYTHLTYEDYKELERQFRAFAETSHKSEGGFYHKSIRVRISAELMMEFHGPMVGGYGHLPAEPKETNDG